MLLIILLVLALTVVQALLPGKFLTEQVGPAAQMGPRDELPPPSLMLARSRRALANLHETLPVFLTLAVLSIVLGEQGWLSLAGAALFLVGRAVHVVCYLKALSPWRSLAFSVAFVGLLLLVVPLVPHIFA